MRNRYVLLGAAVLAAVGLGVGLACGPVAAVGKPIETSAALSRAIIDGNKLFAVSDKGKLIEADLAGSAVREIALAKGAKVEGDLSAQGGLLAVPVREGVQVLDAASGRLLHALTFKDQWVSQAHFAGKDRLLVQTGHAYRIVEISSGKVLHTIDLPAKRIGSERCRAQLVGTQAYLAHPGGSAVVLLDLETGKVLKTIPAPAGALGAIHVRGERVYVAGVRAGYGLWTQSLGFIDLKSGKYTALKAPHTMCAVEGLELLSGPEGTLLLTGRPVTYRYDSEGKALGTIGRAEGNRRDGGVLGVWKDQVVEQRGTQLHILAKPASTVSAK